MNIRKIYKGYDEGGKTMQKRKLVCNIVGSVITFAVACLVIPQITKFITNKVYRDSVKKKNSIDEDDDWGPEIVKKTNDKEK